MILTRHFLLFYSDMKKVGVTVVGPQKKIISSIKALETHVHVHMHTRAYVHIDTEKPGLQKDSSTCTKENIALENQRRILSNC